MSTLEGKFAFITGAAMGNGEAVAQVMAQKGATVILADVSETVYDTAKNIGKMAYAYHTNVSDYTNVKAVAGAVLAKFGHVDILVNNAGIARFIDVRNMDNGLFEHVWKTNVLGAWNCTKAFINCMIDRKYGRIVNMSSVTGPRVSDPGMMAYGTSKGAVLALTKTTAMDVARYGITVNAIIPGYIMTPMVEHSAQKSDPENPRRIIDGIVSRVPLGRLGEPKEIGYLVAFLASDEAAYITGTEFLIDGGLTLPETGVMGLEV